MNKYIINSIALMFGLLSCQIGDDMVSDKKMGMQVLTLENAINITGNSAVVGGKIIAGESVITQYGVYYSLNQNFTLEDEETQKVIVGQAAKISFLINIENLTPETTYYAKVFISDSETTVYGQEISFKTFAEGTINTPTVTTDSIVDITPNSAEVYGNVVSHGGSGVFERGVCISTSPVPTIENMAFKAETTGIGTFNVTLTGLTDQTKYYVRSYAINTKGVAYSDEFNFTARVVQKLPKATLTNKRATNIDFTSATIHVQMIDNGGADPVEIGVYYGVDKSAINTKFMIDIASIDAEGNFVVDLNSLIANTTYYVRGFVTNSEGESLTSEMLRFHTAINYEGLKYMVMDTIITITLNNETVQLEFLDRNMGSPKVAEAIDDYVAYGYLYQFGRRSDGHQVVNWTSATVGTLNIPAEENTYAPIDRNTTDHSPFYKGGGNENLQDWVKAPNMASTNPSLNHYWAVVDTDPNCESGGTHNPCPPGFRLPTAAEWSELNKIITKREDAFNLLKLPCAGYIGADGAFRAQGGSGGVYLWGSDIATVDAVATNKTVNHGAYTLFTTNRAVRGIEKACALSARGVRIVKQ